MSMTEKQIREERTRAGLMDVEKSVLVGWLMAIKYRIDELEHRVDTLENADADNFLRQIQAEGCA